MLAAAGIDVLVVEDDIAGTKSLLIAPKHFMEFVNPYNRKLVNRAHELGLKVVRHSDGNLWSIMDTLIESGYDGLNPLEPQAGMDLKSQGCLLVLKICLLWQYDRKELLPAGTPDQVEAAVKHAIEVAAPGGGYILCDSNPLSSGESILKTALQCLRPQNNMDSMNNFPFRKTRALLSSPYFIFTLLFLLYMFDYLDRLVIVRFSLFSSWNGE